LRRCSGAVIAKKGSSQANIPAKGEQQMKIKSVLKPKHVARAIGALVGAIMVSLFVYKALGGDWK
jgi:hypothetical protein